MTYELHTVTESKFVPLHTMNTYWGAEVIASLILSLSTEWMQLAALTPGTKQGTQ
jgi:hypothetical protein